MLFVPVHASVIYCQIGADFSKYIPTRLAHSANSDRTICRDKATAICVAQLCVSAAWLSQQL